MLEQDPRPPSEYWSELAQRYFALDPPLLPSGEDATIYQTLIHRARPGSEAARVLVLGATPMFRDLAWPEGSRFLAVDRSADMLEQVWRGPAEQRVQADWRDLALDHQSRDVIVTDGGLSFLDFPVELQRLARTIAALLCDGGIFVTRCYVPTAADEDVDCVMQQFMAGRIENASLLKIRLWMALNQGTDHGVLLSDVWDAFAARLGDPAEALRKAGWNERELQSMAGYRNLDSRYYFPGEGELTACFCADSVGFELVDAVTPSSPAGRNTAFYAFRRQR